MNTTENNTHTTNALNRDSFLACFDVRASIERVNLPQDQHIHIRQLSGAGADSFGIASQKTPELARATLVVHCACDETGTLLFAADDMARVAELPNQVLTPIVDAIIVHNGLSEEAATAAHPTSTNSPSSASGSD